MKVSIIVPIYNSSLYLDKCVNSLLSQTLTDIEIILVNDGSTDDSLSKMKSYDDNRINIFSQKNGGQGSARNLGLTNAKGDYILFVDSDDYIDSNTIVKVNLITGRFHQIRLQLSNINHPIIGDIKYGDQNDNNLYLYAYKLEFYHPVTKELLSFKLLPKWRCLESETIIHRL